MISLHLQYAVPVCPDVRVPGARSLGASGVVHSDPDVPKEVVCGYNFLPGGLIENRVAGLVAGGFDRATGSHLTPVDLP